MNAQAIDPDTGQPQEPRDSRVLDEQRSDSELTENSEKKLKIEGSEKDQDRPAAETHDEHGKTVPTDVAERPGAKNVSHQHADELADEWGEESFPGSDPPAHY